MLYRGLTTGTNFSSLRVYSDRGDRDYAFGSDGTGVTGLNAYFTSSGDSAFAPAGEGLQMVWDLAHEGLQIVQDVFTVGSSYETAGIYHTVEIANTGSSELQIGWRNLYDWMLDLDLGWNHDGPTNQIERADGSVVVDPGPWEHSYQPGADSLARVSLPQGNLHYETLLALGYDPALVPGLAVTTPDEYAFVRWGAAMSTAFDYTADPAAYVADSAGVSWFGRDRPSAYTIAAGQSVRFTQVLFGAIPGSPPPNQSPPSQSVPEPSSAIALLLAGALGWVAKRGAAARDN